MTLSLQIGHLTATIGSPEEFVSGTSILNFTGRNVKTDGDLEGLINGPFHNNPFLAGLHCVPDPLFPHNKVEKTEKKGFRST